LFYWMLLMTNWSLEIRLICLKIKKFFLVITQSCKNKAQKAQRKSNQTFVKLFVFFIFFSTALKIN
jgi:hypothetical protein